MESTPALRHSFRNEASGAAIYLITFLMMCVDILKMSKDLESERLWLRQRRCISQPSHFLSPVQLKGMTAMSNGSRFGVSVAWVPLTPILLSAVKTYTLIHCTLFFSNKSQSSVDRFVCRRTEGRVGLEILRL